MYCVSYTSSLCFNQIIPKPAVEFIEVWSGITAFFRESCGRSGVSRCITLMMTGAFTPMRNGRQRQLWRSRERLFPDQRFYALAVEMGRAFAGPSEVLWEGEVVADMLMPRPSSMTSSHAEPSV